MQPVSANAASAQRIANAIVVLLGGLGKHGSIYLTRPRFPAKSRPAISMRAMAKSTLETLELQPCLDVLLVCMFE